MERAGLRITGSRIMRRPLIPPCATVQQIAQPDLCDPRTLGAIASCSWS